LYLALRLSLIEDSEVGIVIYISAGEIVYAEEKGSLEAVLIEHNIATGSPGNVLYIVMMQYEEGYLTVPLFRQ
jgi:hypothetical protein